MRVGATPLQRDAALCSVARVLRRTFSAAAFAIAASLVLAACASAPAAHEPLLKFDDAKPTRPVDAQHAARLIAQMPAVDQYLTQEIAKVRYPGVAVGLVVDGELVWFKGYGVASLATKA